jgi:RNA polymerase sigma-70 factor, ECF subfamily
MDTMAPDNSFEVEETSSPASVAMPPERREALLAEAVTYHVYFSSCIRRSHSYFKPEDIEEVMQEVYLILIRKIGRFRGDAQLRTWMHRIVSNAAKAHAMRHYRPDRAQKSLDPTDEEIDPNESIVPVVSLAQGEVVSKVRECLVELANKAPMYFDVLLLRDVQGLSGSDTCEMLDIGEPAMKSRLHRARTMLRDIMDQHHLAP